MDQIRDSHLEGDLHLPLCVACGSQYSDEPKEATSNSCKICDDPRQFVPPGGQQWTTLASIQRTHQNKWERDPKNPNLWSIWSEPKFAIGQRAMLLETANGNVLWDLIALLNNSTIEFIKSRGGLKAMVISHPHYYTTYCVWAKAFNCPVYISSDDQRWLCRKDSKTDLTRFIDGPAPAEKTVLPGVTAIKTGGHFPGSLVLHWEHQLFIADTIMTVPSAYTPHPRPPDQTSFAFQWSIPNMIPLAPDDIMTIWRAVRGYDFDTTYGAFNGMTVRDLDMKQRILMSMKTQVRSMGWEKHELLDETV
ncbi:hypothetical protein XPA_002726 [Xanthoria parietina]